jgi:DNA primase
LPRYSDDSREKVRDAVDFIDLVNSRTELRRAGATHYTGLCPFHDERSPSFGINPVEKVYHCFGCGAGGDVFRFVMETEALTFPEALELLADRYSVQLERSEEDPRAAEKREHNSRLLALLERTAAYYVRVLWESDSAAGAREYLSERGLLESVCREFRVGYSPPAWDQVVAASTRAGFSQQDLFDVGLAQRSKGRAGIIDRFRGRLMFPWADTRGHVIGFGARALAADDQPKYLNTSETAVFSKGKQVYGTYLARAAAAKAGAVVLVEGYTDVIALHQAGIRHVVGQMGTALTDGQAAELAKLAPTVLLCLDADTAGQEAMMRAAGVLRAIKKLPEVRVVPLPAGTDPAEVASGEAGAREFGALLEAAVPFARWQIERALSLGDTSSAEGRDRVLSYVSGVMAGVPQGLLYQELLQKVAGALGLSEALAAETLRSARPNSSGGARFGTASAGNGGGPQRALDHRDDAEREFLALCLALPELGLRRLEELDADALFPSPLTRQAAVHLRTHLAAPATDLPAGDDRLSALIAQLVVRAGALEGADAGELDRARLHLELARLEREIAAARSAQAPVSDLALERQRVREELGKLST